MTRPIARVERFFERLLERPAARLFGAAVHPVQIRQHIEREMEAGRVSAVDRTWVPNRFRVLMHPSEVARFEAEWTLLRSDLEEAVLRRARVRGYRMVARPEVLVIPTEDVEAGAVEVHPDALDPGLVRSAAAGLRSVDLEGPRPPRPPIPATGAVATPAERNGRGGGWVTQPPSTAPASPPLEALIEVETSGGGPWAYVFRGGVARIGRGTDNELVIPDDRVSRRHGQLTVRQGTLVYVDLGSSNGSLVNGSPVREIAIGVGDVVRVGNSTLTIRSG
jgi:hypothetical protein